MSAAPSGWAAGLLLAIAGVWLLLQTLIGSLPSRLIGAFSATSSSGSSAPPSTLVPVVPNPNPGPGRPTYVPAPAGQSFAATFAPPATRVSAG